jgi:signal transduction histidine kinase
MMKGSLFRRILMRGCPEHLGASREEITTDLVAGFLGVSIVCTLVYIGIYGLLGNFGACAGLGLIFLTNLFSTGFLRRGRLTATITSLYAGHYLGLVVVSYFTGGILSPNTPWVLSALPIFVYLVSGSRIGVPFTILNIIVMNGLGLLEFSPWKPIYGFSFPMESRTFTLYTMSGYSGMSLALIWILMTYNRIREEAYRDLDEKLGTIRRLLDNMKQAVFEVSPEGRILPPVSRVSTAIFGGPVEGQSVWETLFKDRVPTTEAGALLRSALTVAFGEDELQWNLVEDRLPDTVHYRDPRGNAKTLKVAYSPIFTDARLERIMLTVDDVTAVLEVEARLARERAATSQSFQMIHELVPLRPAERTEFFMRTQHQLGQILDEVFMPAAAGSTAGNVLLLLHTIKGNARLLKLSGISHECHAAESLVVGAAVPRVGAVLAAFWRVARSVGEYAAVAEDVLQSRAGFRGWLVTETERILEPVAPMRAAAPAADPLEALRVYARGFINFIDQGQLSSALPAGVELDRPRLETVLREGLAQLRPELPEVTAPEARETGPQGVLPVLRENYDELLAYVDGPEGPADAVWRANLRRRLERLQHVALRDRLERFREMVRELVQKTGKAIDYAVDCGPVGVPPTHVNPLMEALGHLIRNAIDHGIEDAITRQRAGKAATGRIQLRARAHEDGLEIEVSDDGAGVDLARLEARHFARTGTHAVPSLELLFVEGLSTKEIVTEVSGRGIGMTAARRLVEGLGGTMRVGTRVGEGTTFTLSVPFARNS